MARQNTIVVNTENFTQTARTLEGTMNAVIASGNLTCGSADAVPLANATQGVLGRQVCGGVRNAPNGSDFHRDRPNEIVWDPDSGMVIGASE